MASAKSLYTKLAVVREQFLQRARHNALLTIPSLMPLEGHDGRAHLIEPYQGIGARGTVHLSSRMLVGFLPAGRPYMRMDLPPEIKMQTAGEQPTEVTKGLALAEQLLQSEVEAKDWREATLMTLQQLIVAGNALEQVLDNNTIRVFRLDQYVVRRNHDGQVLEIIIMEKFDRDALPFGVKAPAADTASSSALKEADQVELYTHIKLIQQAKRTFYRRTQEWGNGSKASASQTFKVADLPYIALRWSATPGEDYGRSKIEEHVADLRSLDALEKAQLEMAGMASRNFIMVAPGAGASGIKNRLVRALNGDVLVGDPDSVDLKSFDNAAGFQITAQQVQVLRESLSDAFLLQSVGQRQAERVTATEIERDIQEIEAALGGVFSTLSTSMMERRTVVLMKNMVAQKKLPYLPEGSVQPTILTGLEALSRERDVSRAQQAAELVRAFLSADESAGDVVKLDTILGRAFIGLGLPDSVRTEDETRAIREQRREQQQQEQMLKQAAPLIKAAGSIKE